MFKKGDKVICIENRGANNELLLNKIYTVESDQESSSWVRLESNELGRFNSREHFSWRFSIAPEAEHSFKPGDRVRCIDDSKAYTCQYIKTITKGKEYLVIDNNYVNSPANIRLEEMDCGCKSRPVRASYFEKVMKNSPEESLITMLREQFPNWREDAA